MKVTFQRLITVWIVKTPIHHIASCNQFAVCFKLNQKLIQRRSDRIQIEASNFMMRDRERVGFLRENSDQERWIQGRIHGVVGVGNQSIKERKKNGGKKREIEEEVFWSLIERVGAEIVERAASEPPKGEKLREPNSKRWERERELFPSLICKASRQSRQYLLLHYFFIYYLFSYLFLAKSIS